MDKQYTSEEVRKFVVETFESHKQDEKAVVALDSAIAGDLAIDSLSVMEIVSDLEDEYDLEFSDDDLPKVHNVGDVVALVEAGLRDAGRLS